MVKLLLAVALIASLYLGFAVISQYNGCVTINIAHYRVHTTLFFLIFAVAFSTMLLIMATKAIFNILNIPNFLLRKFSNNCKEKNLFKLAQAYSFVITENYDEAKKSINGVRFNNHDFSTLLHPLLYKLEDNFDQQMYHLRQLLDHRKYKFFAAKYLAKNFINHGYYQKGLGCLQTAYNINEYDEEVIEMMVKIYSKLHSWGKFNTMIKKLESVNHERSLMIAPQIANCYFEAAKSKLEIGEENSAITFLQQALACKPDFLEAIELLCILNVNLNQKHLNIEILTKALEESPSLELVRLYILSSDLTATEVFHQIQSISGMRHYLDVLIPTAAILKLDGKLKQLVAEYNEAQ